MLTELFMPYGSIFLICLFLNLLDEFRVKMRNKNYASFAIVGG